MDRNNNNNNNNIIINLNNNNIESSTSTTTLLSSILEKSFPQQVVSTASSSSNNKTNKTNFDIVTTITQANAEGFLISLPPNNNNNNNNNEHDDHPKQQQQQQKQEILFVKLVDATKYSKTKKSWPDFRRTLMYLRTEVAFYKHIVPELQLRGLSSKTIFPHIYDCSYNLTGLISPDEKATDQSIIEPTTLDWSNPTSWEKDCSNNNDDDFLLGGYIVMEGISNEYYYQDSPISIEQAKLTLSAVAELHASAWEDVELLQKADTFLSRGSYHLKTRNVKELNEMEIAWDNFKTNFQNQKQYFDVDDSEEELLFQNDLGKRIKNLAQYISDVLSPSPNDQYATLSHGDYKSMNCFLPKTTTNTSTNTNTLSTACSNDDNDQRDGDGGDGNGVIMVDFASTGVGLGMSDVAMQIHHAVLPENLDNGGEEELFDHYYMTLCELLLSKQQQQQRNNNNESNNNNNNKQQQQQQQLQTYPRDIAIRHYRYAVVDYFRFFLGRFWKTATPETMLNKQNNKNTALINRNVNSAMAFLRRVNKYVIEIENEKKELDGK